MTQMPKEPIGEEGRVNPKSSESDVVLEFEEEEMTIMSRVAKGNKLKKVIQVLDKVK